MEGRLRTLAKSHVIPDRHYKGLKRYILERLPHLKEIKPLDALLNMALSNLVVPFYRQHKYRDDCFREDYRLMQKAFGRNYKAILERSGLIEIVGDYSVSSSATYPYKVTTLFHELVAGYQASINLLDKCVQAPNYFPEVTNQYAAIASRERNSKLKCRTQFNLNRFVPLNVSLTSNVHRRYRDWSDELSRLHSEGTFITASSKQRAAKLARWLGALSAVLMRLARDRSTQRLGVVETYSESRSGRLYGHSLSLQNIPKEVRYALMTGYTDWDFEACHPAILANYMRLHHYALPTVESYVQMKAPMRRVLATEVGVDLGQIKKAITVLVYGASITNTRESALVNILGREGVQAFRTNPFLATMAAELREASVQVLRDHQSVSAKGSVVTNVLGKEYLVSDGVKSGSLVSHVLQGYEARMLEIIMQAMAGPDGITHDVRIIQHDGFTTEVPTHEGIARGLRAILEDPKLGFEMELSHQVIHYETDARPTFRNYAKSL